MKVIFIFPGLILTFPLFFMRAVDFIDARLQNSFHWVRTVFHCLGCDTPCVIYGRHYHHDPIALFP